MLCHDETSRVIKDSILTAEKLWNTLLDSLTDGLVVVDREGLVIQMSPSLAAALQLKSDDLMGLPLRSSCSCFHRMAGIIRSGEPELGRIETIGADSALVDYLPVMSKGKVVGAMARVYFLGTGPSGGEESSVDRGRKKTATGFYAVRFTDSDIIGPSQQMADLKKTMLRVAQRDSNILVTGESGTGKEMFAQAIHAASLRKEEPFVKINCAAIPESLLESEFFGYEEGTFTGSKKGGRKGKLELADRGTVFLDEIGDLSLTLQAKLLRFIQDREIQKLGGSENIKSDVRVIAATNIDPEQLTRRGRFREDLYYRLNVVNIMIPPLRERMEDVVPLARHFIEKFNRVFRYRVSGLSPKAESILLSHNWPGNVRELGNVIERAFNVLDGNIIQPAHLPEEMLNMITPKGVNDSGPVEFVVSALSGGQGMNAIIASAEKTVIMQALLICRGNKAKVSKMLGISRPGLYKKMVKLGIE